MRKPFIPALILVGAAAFIWIAAVSAQGTPQIAGPKRVVVRAGGTVQLTGQNCPSGHTCGFEMYPGHDATSSVTSGGLYTAPATAPRTPKIGGCPTGPHNAVYNVRIDQATSGLLAYPDSGTIIEQMKTTGRFATYFNIHAESAAAANVMDNTAPFVNFVGDRSVAAVWNGSYRFVSAPGVPIGSGNATLTGTQFGWFRYGGDNRYISVNKDNCDITEIYFGFNHPIGESWDASPYLGANMSGFYFYNALDMLNGNGLKGTPTQGSTAGGMSLVPLQLTQQQMIDAIARDGANGDVGHALAMTLTNFAIGANTTNNFLWPATSLAGGCNLGGTNCGGYPQGYSKYGTRYRLKKSFVDSYKALLDSNPTIESANPRVRQFLMVLLHTVERYGLLMMDGTTNQDTFSLHVRGERIDDPDYDTAMNILRSSPYLTSRPYAQTTTITPLTTFDPTKSLVHNLEAVDESSFAWAPDAFGHSTSNVVLAPYVKPERVIWRDLTAGIDLDYRDISVNPATVGTLENQLNVVSGATIPFSRYIWSSGLASASYTYTVVSGPGSISPSGVFTPAEVSAPAISTVRIAAAENSSASTDIRVVTLPAVNSKLCVRLAPFTNVTSTGCTWWGNEGSGTTGTLLGILGGYYTGNSAVNRVDAIYPLTAYKGGAQEGQMALHLPNGRWKVTTLAYSGPSAGACTGDDDCNPAHKTQIELNDTIVFPPAQWWPLTGETSWTGAHYTIGVPVTDGRLSLGFRRNGTGIRYPYFSALVIEPDPTHPSVVLGNKTIVGGGKVLIQQQ